MGVIIHPPLGTSVFKCLPVGRVVSKQKQFNVKLAEKPQQRNFLSVFCDQTFGESAECVQIFFAYSF